MSSSKHNYAFILSFLIILILSAFLHFYNLDIRPLHHDEGHNALWALAIKTGMPYSMGPGGRHGPLPHFLNVLAFYLLGDSDTSVRFFAALWGVGLLVLLYPARRLLGHAGTLASALLLGLSPLMIYYSRFAINEIFLVFFTLALALVLYLWLLEGKKHYFLLAAGILALMLATKETWIISLPALGAALAVTVYLHRQELPPLKISSWLTPKILGGGIILFLLLLTAFYTNFFSKFREVFSLSKYHSFWLSQGLSGGDHVHPFFTYLTNISLWEFPMLLLAALSLLLWLKFRDPVGTYLVFWAFFTFLAYSLIEYKTPWLIINIILPWGLLAGRSIKYLTDFPLETTKSKKMVPLMGLLLAGCFLLNLGRTMELNFLRYDDPELWVVYGQEPRYIKVLYNKIYRVARAQENPNNTSINALLGLYEKSPTNWYLRRFPGKIFYDNPGELTKADIVLFSDSTQSQVLPKIEPENYETGRIRAKPGIVLHLWIKKEAWQSYQKKSSAAKG